MRRFRSLFTLLLLTVTLTVLGASLAKPDVPLDLSDRQLSWIAGRIFQNECAGDTDCLVHWSEGDDFPSLGIGHFKWYPKGVEEPYAESFPQLVHYMASESVGLPEWLANMSPLDAPWPDRETFLMHQHGPQVEFLRWFLDETRHIQARFMYERTQDSLDEILAATPKADRPAMRERMDKLRSTLGGVYALIDYVNFKGEGLADREAYHGQGWGLRQVLMRMGDIDQGTALERFRVAAADVLKQRANNAPSAVEKKRLLAGWLNRVSTYHEVGQV
ncbi:hypothetical protein EZI54_21560 [Marinobacter halodurans]|uniref:Uncharacterized protein n=1 Tax=Marinobacter halodurans TaxID=2528979 RepID=A0ABY1ZIF1_9GAMM|nr:hypothetical protein [Marinobacter halodurans]TBW48226.1 hypothetical protein EZI54_21560 [Marinobacter halodurans]